MSEYTDRRFNDVAREARLSRTALQQADALAAYIVEHLLAEELSTHVEFSFAPEHAAMIANMAERYQRARTAEGANR